MEKLKLHSREHGIDRSRLRQDQQRPRTKRIALSLNPRANIKGRMPTHRTWVTWPPLSQSLWQRVWDSVIGRALVTWHPIAHQHRMLCDTNSSPKKGGHSSGENGVDAEQHEGEAAGRDSSYARKTKRKSHLLYKRKCQKGLFQRVVSFRILSNGQLLSNMENMNIFKNIK